MATMTVWEDDLPEELMERIAGVLCEFGIIVKQHNTGTDGDFITYEYLFERDEYLDENVVKC